MRKIKMRLWIAALLVGATSLPLAACDRQAKTEKASPTAVAETPKRKAGLWRQTMSIEDIGVSQSANVCLDPGSDSKLAWWAQQGVRGGCARNDVTRQPDGAWAFSSSCQMAGGIHMNTKGTATGDFESAYKVIAQTTTTGAPMAQMNGTRTTVIEAEWVGECPAGMNPGEMELPDGRRIDMLAMTTQDAGQP